MELEETAGDFDPPRDHRPHMPEPLPVKLVAVEDCTLPAPAGVDDELDAFYVGLLQFQRVAGELTFRAENFLLRFDVKTDQPIVHDSLRPLGVEVPSLADVERKIIELEMEYTRLKGTTPGQETLLVLDPAGNWVEIGEVRLVA